MRAMFKNRPRIAGLKPRATTEMRPRLLAVCRAGLAVCRLGRALCGAGRAVCGAGRAGCGAGLLRPARVPVAVAAVIALTSAVAWLQTPARVANQNSIASLLPSGAKLVLEAKDFSSLLADWNGSSEKATWLAGDTNRAFSRSRLFLRLKDAYEQFESAAGMPPDMALLADVAGSESAFAIYDIGKLEFLYVTRLPSARTIETMLWRSRGNYEPRQAAGTPFYVRVDRESQRVVAFGVRDQYLLLATREDLLAGALTLVAGQGGSAVEGESWFARAIGAAGPAGDLRMVMNLEALLKDPRFQSYWIQHNAGELKPFASAVSDLVRAPGEIREQRVLLRSDERPSADSQNVGLGGLVRLVPDGAGLYRAWAAPSASDAKDLILRKIIAPSVGTGPTDRTAPRVAGFTGVRACVNGECEPGAVGSGDLESRIDEDNRAPLGAGYQTGALDQLTGASPLTGMLHLESTRAASDDVFVDRGSVVVLGRGTDWSQDVVRTVLRTLVEPVWTKAGLGMAWTDQASGAQAFSQLEGLERLAIATRGPLLFLANDPALLRAVLESMSKPALTIQGEYAAGFRHALERARLTRVMRFVDHAAALRENREPLFFSENLVSLSQAFSRVDSASIVEHDAGTTVSQTVTYRLAR
jgi:hypothetical protein